MLLLKSKPRTTVAAIVIIAMVMVVYHSKSLKEAASQRSMALGKRSISLYVLTAVVCAVVLIAAAVAFLPSGPEDRWGPIIR
jgi:uncharacterized membrane protein YeiB